LPAQVAASFDQDLSSKDITEGTVYSGTKLVFRCKCGNSKHMAYLAVDTVMRNAGVVQCRVCRGRGSDYEQEAYSVLDTITEIQAYAVEAHAVTSSTVLADLAESLGQHPWDVMLLKPGKVLIEVQGEQHTHKDDTRRNNRGATVADQHCRDTQLADAAVAAGFAVVWLVPGDSVGRSLRWRAAIKLAVADMQAHKAPRLYVA
jgi:hypothetical protein